MMQQDTTTARAAGLLVIYASLIAVVAVELWRPADHPGRQQAPSAHMYVRNF